MSVCIYNVLGEMVKQSHITGEKDEISIAELPTGSYFVKIQDQVLRLLKE